MFADLIGFHVNMAGLLQTSEANLGEERASGLQREQFIAVLGHDLRNPLASVQAGITMLRKRPDEDRRNLVLDRMQSSVDRMALLVDDILDFARGRLGDGISLAFVETDVGALVNQVVAELASHHLDRAIVIEGQAGTTVFCDPQRVGQLVSNLVGNALTHGSSEEPIRICSSSANEMLEIYVANGGDEISADARSRLFQPYERGGQSEARQGLGLGLYIASTIAHAHHGTLAVASSPVETRFTFTMPLAPARP